MTSIGTPARPIEHKTHPLLKQQFEILNHRSERKNTHCGEENKYEQKIYIKIEKEG